MGSMCIHVCVSLGGIAILNTHVATWPVTFSRTDANDDAKRHQPWRHHHASAPGAVAQLKHHRALKKKETGSDRLGLVR